MKPIRIATYNIHKCRGIDRRTRPGRIVEVLSEIDADVIALQEVVSRDSDAREDHQAGFIAEELGFEYRIGENRRHLGGAYGNVVLSRLPFAHVQNYDITVTGREERGSLRTDLMLDEINVLHVFNVHLGTAYAERRHQARKLLAPEILSHEELHGARVVLGDFNEWAPGLASQLLAHHFTSAKERRSPSRVRTFPAIAPLLRLDHIYFDPALRLENVRLHRSRRALVASDHLPLVADFQVMLPQQNGSPQKASD